MGDEPERDAQGAEEVRPSPEVWTVSAARGREVAQPERGLPRLAEITLTNEAGFARTFRARHAPRVGDPDTGVANPIACAPVVPIRVSRCLICLQDAGPWTNEHVPPKNFGGEALLVTCARCNNGLGSLEGALLEWYDQRRRSTLFAASRQSPIGAGWLTTLTSDDGEVLMINDQTWSVDPERDVFAEHARQGERFEMDDSPPRAAAYLNAALKQSYLAACILLGGVPAVPSADETRSELVAARDAGIRAAVLGPRAASVGLRAVEVPDAQPPISLYLGTTKHRTDYLICLGGTLLLDWPFPELDPQSWRGRHRRVGH